jgi:DNA invertase Pin-like site-specific DNA recombinase
MSSRRYDRPKGLTLAEARSAPEEFTEVESGKRAKRPELERAIAACRRNKAKLVIAKLDRLARNVAFISSLMDSKIEFVAVDQPQPTS